MNDVPYGLEFFTLRDANVRFVLFGCVALATSAGLIGCFAFLRKRSLIGDALAHAALPGVCAAFMLTGVKNPLVMLAGATASCWLGALSVEAITRYTRCKEDSALGMVLSVYFGVGILMLTSIQKSGAAAQAGLDKYLFGQAASLVSADVWTIGAVSALVCAATALGYKELKAVSFDPEFAAAIGLPRRFTEIALATLIVLAVAIGLQAVGVVLMAAMLVTPPAAARYWTDRLHAMLLLSAAFGAASGVIGAYVSYVSAKMPTGPWMVVAVTSIFLASLLFARRRGAVPRLLRHWRYQRRTARENVLRTLYLLGERNGDWRQSYTTGEMLQYRNMSPRVLEKTLERLRRDCFVAEPDRGHFALTVPGRNKAARITRLHRLWELYLTRKLELAPDHVHDDAEEIEHIITPEMEARLIASVGEAAVDPHQKAIPGLAPGEEG